VKQRRDRVAELLAAPPTDAVLEELAAIGLEKVARRDVRRRRGAEALLRGAERALLEESGRGGSA
jgi:hypothetical protein